MAAVKECEACREKKTLDNFKIVRKKTLTISNTAKVCNQCLNKVKPSILHKRWDSSLTFEELGL